MLSLPLKQRELPWRARAFEPRCVDLGAPSCNVQSEPPARVLEALVQQFREQPRAGLARTEVRIVFLATAQVSNPAHDVRRLERVMMLEPILEQILQLPGKRMMV